MRRCSTGTAHSTNRCSPANPSRSRRAGERGDGATANTSGRVVRGHPGRRRHPAGGDRPVGHRGADGKGPGDGPRRPGVGRVRPGGPRHRRPHPRRSAAPHPGRRGRVHRGRRRPRHRLSVAPSGWPRRRRCSSAPAGARQLGILDQGPGGARRTRRIDTVVLDKTGTVTEGRMSLTGIVAAPGEDADVVLRLAGAVEAASEHPVGAASPRCALGLAGATPGRVVPVRAGPRGARGRRGARRPGGPGSVGSPSSGSLEGPRTGRRPRGRRGGRGGPPSSSGGTAEPAA